MKKTLLILSVILATILTFTVGALELDTVENDGVSNAVLSADDLGELVFSVDFEGVSSVTNGGVITKTSANFGSQNVLLYSRGMNMTYGIAKPVASGSNMLSMAATDYHGCVAFQGYSLTKPGTYTLTYDHYYKNLVAYQSYAINAAPSTVNSVHAATSIQNVSTTYELAEGKTISFVQIQFAKHLSGSTDSPVYIDNVKLYYKAPIVETTVSIYKDDANVYSSAKYQAGEKVNVPAYKDFFEFTPDGKYLTGFNVNGTALALGSTYTVTSADASAGTVAIKPVWSDIPNPEYGTPIWVEDFARYADNTAIASGAAIAQPAAGYTTGSAVLAYHAGSNATYTVATVKGQKMLKVTGDGTNGYPQFRAHNINLNKAGEYTFTYDYYVTGSTCGIGGMMAYFPTQKAIGTFNYSGNIFSGVLSNTLAAGSTIGFAGFHGVGASGTYYIGNLMVYYKEPSKPVDITVKSGDTVVISVSDYKDAKYTLPSRTAFAEYCPVDCYVKGLEIGGTAYAFGADYVITADDAEAGVVEVEVVYETKPNLGYGELLFFEDFEGYTTDTPIHTTTDNLGTYALAFRAMPNLSMSSDFIGKAFGFCNGDAVSGVYDNAIITDDGTGNKAIKVVEKTAAGNNFVMTKIWGGQAIGLGLGNDGVYTMIAKFFAPENSSEIKTFRIMMNTWNSSTGSGDYVLKEVAVEAGGTWYEVVCVFDFSAEVYDKISQIALMATTGAGDGVTFYIDEVALYYEASKKPESVDVTSIRTTGVTGLRFMSFVNNAVRSIADEYGYMVAVENSAVTDYESNLVFAAGQERTENSVLTNNGISFLCAANFDKATGKDIVYSTTDENLPAEKSKGNGGVYFTGVMTGIPQSGYTKVLVVRPYIVVGDSIFYGTIYKRSLYEVAKAFSESEGYTGNSTIDEIINFVESQTNN